MTINVCLSCDDNYCKYAAVVIASILKNAKESSELCFYILNSGLEEENKRKLDKLKDIRPCEIEYVLVDESKFEVFKSVKTHSYITIQTNFRLKLASLLPDVDRIIYFDCDMVVNDDLEELFNTELGNNLIGAVLDARTKHKRKWKNSKYINAGMVLFDLKKFKEEHTEEMLETYTLEHMNEIETGDQDIINFALKDRIKILPDEYNVQVSGFANRTCFTRHPKVIHYIGSDKPWKFGSNTFFKELFYKYFLMTDFVESKEGEQDWIKKSNREATKRFWKRRAYCIIHPKYWYAFYRSYISNN